MSVNGRRAQDWCALSWQALVEFHAYFDKELSVRDWAALEVCQADKAVARAKAVEADTGPCQEWRGYEAGP